MSFLRSRHEQLADYLRSQILQSRLIEPLPNTRDWASQLGVSCTTLYAALHTLEREKWIIIHPRRGVRLNLARRGAAPGRTVKMVRLVYRGLDYPELVAYSNWCGLLSQRLQMHGIQFSIEKCTDTRLHELAQRRTNSDAGHELLFLRSLSEQYQRLFERSGRPSLVVGYTAPGVSLPFVTCDLEGAIRHAVNAFLRRGFERVVLLINRVQTHAVQRQCDAFEDASTGWPRQPVCGQIVRVPLQPATQIAALCRFASRLKERCGIVVVSPVALGAVMTSLLGHGVTIPERAEIVVIDTIPASTVVWPPPVHYAVSLDVFVKTLTRAAVHFFETGRVPAVGKTLPIEVVRPEEAITVRSPAHW